MKLISTLSLFALFVACDNRLPEETGDPGSDSGSDSATGSDSGTASDTTTDGTTDTQPANITPIADLQNGVTAVDSWVTVEGVLISATHFGIVIQDADGPNNGIWVYLGGSTGDNWYDTFTAGDTLRVSGTFTEYMGSAWGGDATNTLDTVTEIGADVMDVMSMGASMTITPSDISAVDFTDKAALEPYEFTLVSVAGTLTVSATPDTYGEWFVNDTVRIDNVAYDGADFTTDTGATLTIGQTFTKITGFMNYDYGNFKIAPRMGSDLEGFVNPAM